MTDTSFLDFKKILIADVENAESQRRTVIRRAEGHQREGSLVRGIVRLSACFLMRAP